MRLPRSLALLLLVGCSSAPVANDPATNPTSTTSPTASADAHAPTPVATGIETSAANGAPDAAPTATAAATIAASGPIDEPPEPGRYTYRQDGYQTFGALRFNFDPEGTFDVAVAEQEDGLARQRTVRRYAESRERESSTLFRRDAILLEEAIERIGSGSARQTFTCRTPDPVPLLPIPWTVGGTWTGGGMCGDLELNYTATLRAVEQREIDGGEVRALVIDASYTIAGDDLRQETTTTIWFAPDHRLPIRQVEHSSGTFQGTPFERELTEELVSLTPA